MSPEEYKKLVESLKNISMLFKAKMRCHLTNYLKANGDEERNNVSEKCNKVYEDYMEHRQLISDTIKLHQLHDIHMLTDKQYELFKTHLGYEKNRIEKIYRSDDVVDDNRELHEEKTALIRKILNNSE